MTKQEQKLNQIKTAVFKNFGIMGKTVSGHFELKILKYPDLDSEIFWDILIFLRSRKGIELDYNYYCYSIRVFEAEAHAKAEAENNKKNNLIEGFWQTLHDQGREAADFYYKNHIAEYKYFGLA